MAIIIKNYLSYKNMTQIVTQSLHLITAQIPLINEFIYNLVYSSLIYKIAPLLYGTPKIILNDETTPNLYEMSLMGVIDNHSSQLYYVINAWVIAYNNFFPQTKTEIGLTEIEKNNNTLSVTKTNNSTASGTESNTQSDISTNALSGVNTEVNNTLLNGTINLNSPINVNELSVDNNNTSISIDRENNISSNGNMSNTGNWTTTRIKQELFYDKMIEFKQIFTKLVDEIINELRREWFHYVSNF